MMDLSFMVGPCRASDATPETPSAAVGSVQPAMGVWPLHSPVGGRRVVMASANLGSGWLEFAGTG